MQSVDPRVKVVYRVDFDALAKQLARLNPHLNVFVNDSDRIEVRCDAALKGYVYGGSFGLHDEVVYVEGDAKIANDIHTLLDSATRGTVQVMLVCTVPKNR